MSVYPYAGARARWYSGVWQRNRSQLDEALTEAEGRVAEAVARGLSNKEIAAEFSISVSTVENHISHILAKKGFGNRVKIAHYVLDRTRPGEKS